jgi:aspartyl-tRNA(Asn)/glutamyl-tRNA(Gln) amidotransferase subunit B
MDLEIIVGLEIHVQINTQTKLWCRCSNDDFDLEPNTAVCPVCMGFPGQLPVMNEEAVKKGVQTALALNCKIPKFCKFDRKNYFYPDLPMGYQISQYDKPLSEKGHVNITVNGEDRKIGITRLHLENDAGKLTHEGEYSLVDFNRSGTPLMEIVTEPDMRSPEEAKIFAEELQRIVRAVDSSEADMFKGQMRFDASISLRPKGEKKLYPRTEIKNLNSFKALENALTQEVERQSKLWKDGKPQDKEITVGWLADDQKLKFLREKEGADDYRYFPEPDIPPLELEEKLVAKLKKELPELPSEMRNRLIDKYKLPEDHTELLLSDLRLLEYFEKVSKETDVKNALRWVISEWGDVEKDLEMKIYDSPVSIEKLVEMIKLIESGEISGKIGKEVLSDMAHTEKRAAEIVEEKGLKQMSDTGELEKICKEVIDANPKAVEDYKNGKERAFAALVGQVMARTKGQANPKVVNEILSSLVEG